MKTLLSSLIAGLLMGAGFVISGMTNPDNVIGFLDITGMWNPSLILVMSGAVTINLPATWRIVKRSRPVLAARFHLPEKHQLTVVL